VRKRLVEGKLYLERNQKIGLECYEDLLEDMARDEVEAIGKIVENAIHRHFTDPKDKDNLEITIMGSYRRGRPACGDVDVLITHRHFHSTVPPTVLGEVVEDLLETGHMAYHLTFIAGMKIRQKDEHHAGGYNDNDEKLVKRKRDKETGSSYMGVFNSPTIPGKRRRVDIKFYPHRERAFAWLYFTGNGFFNRSMRLYADVKKGYQMNDQGLFIRGTNDRVMEAATEKEVFDFLGLEYKEPHERYVSQPSLVMLLLSPSLLMHCLVSSLLFLLTSLLFLLKEMDSTL
jgi:DNA polymerase lambda